MIAFVITIAFIATNVDTLLLLVVLFAAATGRTAKSEVAAGACIGFVLTLAACVLIERGLLAVPGLQANLLGLIPLAIGLVRLRRLRLTIPHEKPRTGIQRATGVIGSAVLVLAGGGDNVSVYVPLFHQMEPAEISIVCIAYFVAFVGLAAFAERLSRPLTRNTRFDIRYARPIVAGLFIFIGLSILLSGMRFG
jgi:cadmium resistance protein CadD (predicted permease)